MDFWVVFAILAAFFYLSLVSHERQRRIQDQTPLPTAPKQPTPPNDDIPVVR